MSSDDERSENKKYRYEGGDWRRLTSRIKPVLYAQKSEAYPDKNLFQLLKMDTMPKYLQYSPRSLRLITSFGP